jgi:hypothetical protein
MRSFIQKRLVSSAETLALVMLLLPGVPLCIAQQAAPASMSVAVGPQYDTTHVYVSPSDLDAFVSSFTATFGGQGSKKVVANILPVPSNTTFQYVWTPVGTLSVFAFTTPIPFPFGSERTGYLVTDLNEALDAARGSGAEVLVSPFHDPVGLDAVIQWQGGVRTQLYWHTTAPSYGPLETVPDNRVYVSPDRADGFLQQFLQFTQGKVLSDNKSADAGEIGSPGKSFRRIRIESPFGKMQINVTDGHIPYPFGRELTGYQVADLDATLAKAKASGAKVLFEPYSAADRTTAVIEFPGGYIAEVHALKKQ